MSIQFQQLRDECYRKVYSYKCDNHVKCEVVSTWWYPLACTRHVPIYLFTGIDKKTSFHFHWVSCFKKYLLKKLTCTWFFKKTTKKSIFCLLKTESWTRTHDYNLHMLRNQFNTASESSWTGNSFQSVFNYGPPLRWNLSTLWPGESRYSWSMNCCKVYLYHLHA